MKKGLIKRLLSILVLLPVVATVCVAPTVSAAEDDPIIYYDFEDGKAIDKSGNGNDAAPYGTLKQVAGVSGDAMYFSGGYVELPKMDFSQRTAFSVSVWACTLQLEGQNYSRIFTFGKDGNNLFDLVAPNNNNHLPLFRIGGQNITGDMTSPISYGVWSQLVYTYVDEGNGGRLYLYKDGVQVSTGTTGYKLSQLGTVPGTLGRAPVLNIADYYGYID